MLEDYQHYIQTEGILYATGITIVLKLFSRLTHQQSFTNCFITIFPPSSETIAIYSLQMQPPS